MESKISNEQTKSRMRPTEKKNDGCQRKVGRGMAKWVKGSGRYRFQLWNEYATGIKGHKEYSP